VFVRDEGVAMERRIFYGMCVAVGVAVLASMLWWPWRVTTGLLLGGLLSLLNHHWLRSSIMAALSSGSGVPHLGITRFVLRYFVVTAAVIAAYMLDLVSIVATLVGLCSFVVAALLEAFMQVFYIIVHREGH
jgi:hypothetical protein